jgi:hypothetical protein
MREHNMSEFTQYDDTIDSRDIEERIKELREELDIDENGEPNEYDEGDEKPEALADDVRDELEEELRELLELKQDIEDASGDRCEYGITLIADSYFEDYAREYAEDIHGSALSEAAWPFDSIDWESAASGLRRDYTEVEWGGYSFWVR